MSMSTEIRPTLGSHASRTAKMYLRMIARKKIGIDIPSRDATRLRWSKSPPWRFAARKPSGTPRRIGTSRNSRRTRYRSIQSAGCAARLLLPAREEHRGERVGSHRARLVALHLLLEGESRSRVRVRNAGQELHDQDVRLLVELDPLLVVRL